MSVVDILKEARSYGVILSEKNGNFEVKSKQGNIPENFLKKLSQNKAKILEFLQSCYFNNEAYSTIISQFSSNKILAPLSHAQKRMLLESKLSSEMPVYIVRAAYNFRGKLNIPLLEKCIQILINRHNIFKTTFIEIEGIPYQKVIDEINFCLDKPSLFDMDDKNVSEYIDQFFNTKLDLNSNSLIQASLIQKDEFFTVFLIKVHHIIIDGWSIKQFMQELSILYNSNSDYVFKEIELDYRDYAIWENQESTQKFFDKQLVFWANELKDITILDLPVNNNVNCSQQSMKSTNTLFWYISKQLTDKIRKLSNKNNCTLYTVLLSCFIILLNRYTCQKDILIGIPVSNRFDLKMESIFGLFVNTIPFRLLIDNEIFSEFLIKVQSKLSQLSEFQQVPLDKIIKHALEKDYVGNYQQFFQVLFNYSDEQEEPLNLNGIDIESILTPNPYSPFKLSVDIKNVENQLIFSIDYATNIFTSLFIQRFFENYCKCIESIIISQEDQVKNLRVLSDSEYRLVVEKWNNTEDYTVNYLTPIPLLIQKQCAIKPNKIALVDDRSTINYYELDRQAKIIAAELQYQGAKPGDFVIVIMDRSIERVIALVGILYAGVAYIPLEISTPEFRIKTIIADAKPLAIITETFYQNKITEITDKPILNINVLLDGSKKKKLYKKVEISEADLAYTIYTSGSTGIPKGVMIQHAGISNRLLWMQKEYSLTENDRVMQKTPYSFDVSVWEFFWPLIIGASIVVIKPDGHKDPEYLLEQINKHKVTILHFVPSMLNAFMNTVDIKNCASLSQVFCSGEALSRKDVNKFLLKLKKVKLHNLYGPTEASVDVTYQECYIDSQNLPVPIGKPISNMKVYVLDESSNPVPIGVSGELHLSGIGLAKGYLNAPNLTAEKFIDNQFSYDIKYQKLYKTGDLVKWNEEGYLNYLGRIDHQVKLRGLRIELGEIEATLTTYFGVQQAVVLLKEINKQKKLVGYLQADVPISVKDLRAYLIELLPEYMVPSYFIQINTFPLNKNGKVDRRELEKTILENKVFLQLEDLNQNIKPKTDVEKIIAEVWREVLGVEVNDITSNFFHLGGDSISLMQIVAKLRKRKIYIRVKDLFEKQTIKELINIINHFETLEITSRVSGNEQKLSPIQYWFFEQKIGNYNYWNQLFKLKPKESLNVQLLEQAIKYVINYHDVFSLRFNFNQTWVARYEESSYVFSNINLSDYSYAEQKQKMLEFSNKAHASLNISRGPLACFLYFELGNERGNRLLIIVHHLIIDGVSWRILIEDINTAYFQLKENKPIDLLEKTSSYQNWANELEKYVKIVEKQPIVDYWRCLSKEAKSNIGRMFKKGLNNYTSQKTISICLNKKLTQVFLTWSIKYYNVHVNTLLLLPLIQTFYKVYGLEYLTVNLEAHGRNSFNQLDVSRTVGWFTSIYPIILWYKKNLTLDQLVIATDQQLQAIPNFGFEFLLLKYMSTNQKLREDLNMVKPLISFNYLGQFTHNIFSNTVFSMADEYFGFPIAGESLRVHEIDIVSVVVNDELRFDWNYSTNTFSEEKIKDLAWIYLDFLEKLILASNKS